MEHFASGTDHREELLSDALEFIQPTRRSGYQHSTFQDREDHRAQSFGSSRETQRPIGGPRLEDPCHSPGPLAVEASDSTRRLLVQRLDLGSEDAAQAYLLGISQSVLEEADHSTQLLWRCDRGLENLIDGGEKAAGVPLDERAYEIFLGGKVVVNARVSDPHRRRDVLVTHPVRATALDEVFGHVEDSVASVRTHEPYSTYQ